jgi:hypothetical protein
VVAGVVRQRGGELHEGLDRRDAPREIPRRYTEHMHANEPVADW